MGTEDDEQISIAVRRHDAKRGSPVKRLDTFLRREEDRTTYKRQIRCRQENKRC